MGPINLIVYILAKFFPPNEPGAGAPEPAPVPAPAPKPEPPKAHWVGDMVVRAVGDGEPIEHSGDGGSICCGTVRLEWVSRQKDEEGNPLRTRTPESSVTVMPYNDFTAAGIHYNALHQLVSKWEDHGWARDIYGRSVLMVAKQFPCFDSSDYLYEDRYFRWFLLCEDWKLTSVYYMSGTDTVTITEDVLDLEDLCWKGMDNGKCFGDDDA